MNAALKLDADTWIISDTHFGHANIIKYCGRPYDHNKIMLREWSELINPRDTVLHLGDVTIWHTRHVFWANMVKELPGKKFLIMGNHDQQWTPKQWRTIAGFTVTEPFIFNGLYFSHEPGMPSPRWDVNIHGHTHNHTPFRRYEKLQAIYYNVSIEGMDYKPVKLGQILDELGT